MEVVGVASSIREALPLLARTTPDVVLADLSLGDGSATELVRAARRARLKARVVIITGFSDQFAAAEAIAAGVSGYLLKSQSAEEMLEAIRAVALGRQYLSPVVEARLTGRLVWGEERAGRAGGAGSGDRPALPSRGGDLPPGRLGLLQQGGRATPLHQRQDGGDPPDEHEPEAGGADHRRSGAVRRRPRNHGRAARDRRRGGRLLTAGPGSPRTRPSWCRPASRSQPRPFEIGRGAPRGKLARRACAPAVVRDFAGGGPGRREPRRHGRGRGARATRRSTPGRPMAAPAPGPAAKPPTPLGPIVPVYPDAASKAGIAGNVTLILTVDATGAVTEVEVEGGLPGGLTEAAVAAARAARFSPATDGDGRPVPARIRWLVQFTLPEVRGPAEPGKAPPPAAATEAPLPANVERFPLGPSAVLSVRVRERGTGKDLPNATVYLEDVGEVVHLDARARAERELAPGAYVVVVRAPGHAQEERVERLHAAERLERTVLHRKGAAQRVRDHRARPSAPARDRRGHAAGRGDPQHPGNVRRSVPHHDAAAGRGVDRVGPRLSGHPGRVAGGDRHLHRRDQGPAALPPRLRARGRAPALPRVAGLPPRQFSGRVRALHGRSHPGPHRQCAARGRRRCCRRICSSCRRFTPGRFTSPTTRPPCRPPPATARSRSWPGPSIRARCSNTGTTRPARDLKLGERRSADPAVRRPGSVRARRGDGHRRTGDRARRS